jgi:TM2 domain-containing membrane protein YozV
MKNPTLFLMTSLVVTYITVLSAQEAESTSVLQPKIATYDFNAIPKDPLASAFFSATIPGSGQIYNKEYLRGILTGIGFWGGLFTSEFLLYKWIRINTDTVYFQELDKNGNPSGLNRAVYIMRDENEQVGLPTGEKIALGCAVLIGASSYVFGIIDSYRGAKRFNRKLVAQAGIRPGLYCSLGITRNEAGVCLHF